MELSKIKVRPQIKGLLDHICNTKMAQVLTENNLNIEVEVFEIVKIQLREVAKHQPRHLSEKELIEKTINKVDSLFEEKLHEILPGEAERILDKFRENYLSKAKKELSTKGSESQKLLKSVSSTASLLIEPKGNTLRLSPAQILQSGDVEYENVFDRLKEYSGQEFERASLGSKSNFSLELSRVGFDEFIEGLTVNPSFRDTTDYFISLQNLPEEFSLAPNETNCFPFEILADRLVFILDQDGSLFVFVENFSPKLLENAGFLLIKLSKSLYYS